MYSFRAREGEIGNWGYGSTEDGSDLMGISSWSLSHFVARVSLVRLGRSTEPTMLALVVLKCLTFKFQSESRFFGRLHTILSPSILEENMAIFAFLQSSSICGTQPSISLTPVEVELNEVLTLDLTLSWFFASTGTSNQICFLNFPQGDYWLVLASIDLSRVVLLNFLFQSFDGTVYLRLPQLLLLVHHFRVRLSFFFGLMNFARTIPDYRN